MKRKLITYFLLGSCMLWTACGVGNSDADINDEYEYSDDYIEYESDNDDEYEEYEEDEEEVVEMTQEQMKLLCTISMDEDRVKEGRLFNWQKEVLNQYNYAMDYLARKYPSYSFEIVNCAPKNKLNAYTTFYFCKADETDTQKVYEIYMEVYEDAESENRYVAEDNFYGELFEDVFAERMYELIKPEFPECVNVTCNMTGVLGEEFGENLDLDKLFCGELDASQDIVIYMNAEGMSESDYIGKIEEIQDYIASKQIKGSYNVKFIMEDNFEKVLYRGHFFGR